MTGLTATDLRALADLVERILDGAILTGVLPRDLLGEDCSFGLELYDRDIIEAVRSTHADVAWFAEVTHAADKGGGCTLLALTPAGWTEV